MEGLAIKCGQVDDFIQNNYYDYKNSISFEAAILSSKVINRLILTNMVSEKIQIITLFSPFQ